MGWLERVGDWFDPPRPNPWAEVLYRISALPGVRAGEVRYEPVTMGHAVSFRCEPGMPGFDAVVDRFGTPQELFDAALRGYKLAREGYDQSLSLKEMLVASGSYRPLHCSDSLREEYQLELPWDHPGEDGIKDGNGLGRE